jgi:DNA helicase IV
VHRVVDLGRTFRSVDQIAFAAKKFVLQNPAQLTKTVIPAGTTTVPALRVVSTLRDNADEKLRQVLRSLQDIAVPEGKKASVLLLGRNRYNETPDLLQLRQAFPDLKRAFKTIHSSKGQEADHVILVNLFRGRSGFPSEIVDDPLLSLVSPEAEPFENAEERRVIYVALTRARRTVTLMSAASKQSAFVTELLDDPEYGVVGDVAHDQPPGPRQRAP